MKSLVLAACVAAMPAMLLAQAAAPADAPVKAPAAAVKAPATAAAKKPESRSPAEIRRSALKAVEEVTPIDEDPNVKLTAEDIEVAKRVFVGTIPCELGNSVTITPSNRRPGFFLVQTKGARFSMHPVESRTGAIRLEDPKRGAMWLQLGNKSMLMSQKIGQRLADECTSPEQITLAEELKKNPRPGLLDSPVAAPATAASAPVLTSVPVPASAPASASAPAPAESK
jgi:Ni/Co efflux regulator RcnB